MRFPPVPVDKLSPDQRRVHDAIAGGPRGGVRGPFAVLLRSPDVADRVPARVCLHDGAVIEMEGVATC